MATTTLNPRVQSTDVNVQPFPLPLTAFERYMIADDHPDRPMTFVIEITLSGELRNEELIEAHQQALLRHPLLRSCTGKHRGKACWQLADLPGIKFDPEHTELHRYYFDLNHEPGLKTTVRKRDGQIVIAFLFHHAVTDGVGAMRFIGDVLGIYGQLTTPAGEEAPELSPIDIETLTKRGQLWSPGSRPEFSLWETIKHLSQFLGRYAAGVETGSQGRLSESERHCSPFVSRIVDGKTLRSLKKAAAKLGVQLNDLCLVCLFQTIKQWNAQHRTFWRRRWYRMLVPVSLRTPDHDELPAANVLSYLIFYAASNNNESIEKMAVRYNQLMHGFLHTTDRSLATHVILTLSKIPGMLWMLTKPPVRLCTSVLANVGEVKRQLNCRFPLQKGKCVAGSLTLEGLFGAAPIRRGTTIGISLGTYAGDLLVNFNCDRNLFEKDRSEQFADLFISHLQQFVAEQTDQNANENGEKDSSVGVSEAHEKLSRSA